jgi:hypothetical protein
MFSYWFINALIAVIVAMALVALESLYVKSKLSLYQYCQHPVINADEPLTPTLDNAKYFRASLRNWKKYDLFA